jgi:peptidoglycan/xylan/chitin deacetylase (PgdA/CDA1 family)
MPNPSPHLYAPRPRRRTARLTGLAASITLLLAAPLPATIARRGAVLDIPILTYHRIDTRRSTLPKVTLQLTVSPAAFARQMSWLARSGYHPLSAAQLEGAITHGAPLPSHPIVITFDDGYRDVLENAAPVLHAHAFHAIAFVISGRTSGGDPSFLTWRDLTLLERDGVTVESHTATHRDLRVAPANAVRHELVASRHALETHLHHPVRLLSYPYGDTNAQVETLVREAGYTLALTTHEGASQKLDSPFALNRTEVRGSDSLADFVWILRHHGVARVHNPAP